MKSDNEAIKPCPFCGGKAEFKTEGMFDETDYLKCASCKARSIGLFTRDIRERENNKKVVASFWNTRESGESKIKTFTMKEVKRIYLDALEEGQSYGSDSYLPKEFLKSAWDRKKLELKRGE